MLDKEKRVLLEVLDLYREMPHLWNKEHAFYKNRPKRRKSYEKLLKKYSEFDKNAHLNFLKQKLENMRATYFREHKKVKKSYDEGKDVYVPSLWYFIAFSFLGEHANAKQGGKDNQEPVSETCAISSTDDENPTTYTIRELLTPIKGPLESIKREPDEVVESPAKKIASRKECTTTGQAIGLQLRDLKHHQLVIAQKLISDAIFYARTGKLCEESFICLNSNNDSTGTVPLSRLRM